MLFKRWAKFKHGGGGVIYSSGLKTLVQVLLDHLKKGTLMFEGTRKSPQAFTGSLPKQRVFLGRSPNQIWEIDSSIPVFRFLLRIWGTFWRDSGLMLRPPSERLFVGPPLPQSSMSKAQMQGFSQKNNMCSVLRSREAWCSCEHQNSAADFNFQNWKSSTGTESPLISLKNHLF